MYVRNRTIDASWGDQRLETDEADLLLWCLALEVGRTEISFSRNCSGTRSERGRD